MACDHAMGEHVYTAEDSADEQRMNVHVVRMCPYVDASVDVTDTERRIVMC